MQKKIAASGLLASMFGASFAHAADGVDVSGVVSAINGAVTPITAIGGAVLVVLVSAAVFKWVRRAL
ncbi:methyltransferase [Rhodocyclus tenuis]|uniref:Methyltransferase n=1 Tax=Rhodocyclus gracilis TaxID=2929842 RepID=A0ABX0WKJ0_9RHOO|nr:major capsid protein [Rhodocyclus gracilis]NJA90238.1 methyltransferase [Rhodocyclus gracilis]